jgi:hypothetical protein
MHPIYFLMHHIHFVLRLVLILFVAFLSFWFRNDNKK